MKRVKNNNSDKAMKPNQASMVVVLVLAGGLWGGLASASDKAPLVYSVPGGALAQLEWQFESDANPAVPEVNLNGPAGAQAAIGPGRMSLGWQKQLPGLGQKTGYWDLGENGTITLNLGSPHGIAGVDHVRVRVCQWFDDGIYGSLASVVVPGAKQIGSDVYEVDSGPVGGWMVDETVWELEPGTTLSSVLINGPPTGAVIDEIAVEMMTVSPGSAVLLISVLRDGRVEISWPVSAGRATLEANTDLRNPEGWVQVGVQPQLDGGRYVVVVDAGETMQFFRLRQ